MVIKNGLAEDRIYKVSRQVGEIDQEMVRARKLLSKCCAERTRLCNQARLTRKSKRNREEIKTMCGDISAYSLTCLIAKSNQKRKY